MLQAATLRGLTSAETVKANLTQRGFLDGNSAIYLMSDEPRLDYFDELRKIYPRFRTLKDFPELLSLRRTDNHFLYAIEKCIFAAAGTRFFWKVPTTVHLLRSRAKFKRLRCERPRAPDERRDIMFEQSGICKPFYHLVLAMWHICVTRPIRRYFTRRPKK